MTKAFRNLDENSARLLSADLAGGAYFLVRQWIMEEIPMPPKDVAAIALNILDKDSVFCCAAKNTCPNSIAQIADGHKSK